MTTREEFLATLRDLGFTIRGYSFLMNGKSFGWILKNADRAVTRQSGYAILPLDEALSELAAIAMCS